MPKRDDRIRVPTRQQMVDLVRSDALDAVTWSSSATDPPADGRSGPVGGRTPEGPARQCESSAQAIRNWVAQAGRDAGERTDGLRTGEREEATSAAVTRRARTMAAIPGRVARTTAAVPGRVVARTTAAIPGRKARGTARVAPSIRRR